MASSQPYVINSGNRQDIKLTANSIELSDGTTVQDAVESLDQYAKKTDIPQSTNVSFTRNLSSGTKIGTLTIDGTSTDLYSTNNTTYSNATTSSSGLMSASDKKKLNNISFNSIGLITSKTGIYGFRIDDKDSNPFSRVEYIYDAADMSPCYMDFTNSVFSYGSWKDIWFVKNNKPLMLKSNGTVDYYLSPNDYTLRENGEASDITNIDYDGNAMASFPLIWVKRYQDGRYKYVLFCETKYDSDFKAYAHTNASGVVKPYFYWGLFPGSGNATKIRSLSGRTVSKNLGAQSQINGAIANGTGWYIHTWSQRSLLTDMIILLSKSTDFQSVYGNGNCGNTSTGDTTHKTGTLISMGQFFGYNVAGKAVKAFHVEDTWGNQSDRTAGLINNKGTIYVKMTPEGSGYQVTDVTGYIDTGLKAPGTSADGALLSTVNCSEYGMLPSLATGSSTTYYCSGYWCNSGSLCYPVVGGSAYNSSGLCGGFAIDIYRASSYSSWGWGCGLSYV